MYIREYDVGEDVLETICNSSWPGWVIGGLFRYLIRPEVSLLIQAATFFFSLYISIMGYHSRRDDITHRVGYVLYFLLLLKIFFMLNMSVVVTGEVNRTLAVYAGGGFSDCKSIFYILSPFLIAGDIISCMIVIMSISTFMNKMKLEMEEFSLKTRDFYTLLLIFGGCVLFGTFLIPKSTQPDMFSIEIFMGYFGCLFFCIIPLLVHFT